jgi:hypothetical protein
VALYNCGRFRTDAPYLEDNHLFAYFPLTGSGNGVAISDDAILEDIFGNSNVTASVRTSNDFEYADGVQVTPPQAVIALTASSQNHTYNAVITQATGANAQYRCYSFNTDIDITGGVAPVVGDVRLANDIIIPRITGGGSATENEMGIIAENGSDGDPERTNLTQFSGKFGTYSGSAVPESTYTTQPSIYKQQRNTNRRLQSGSTLSSPTFIERHDNMLISTPIPRSEFQYNWITSSLGNNYGYNSGKQRIFGYAPKDGILSSSVIINGDSGFVPALTFPTASEIFGE